MSASLVTSARLTWVLRPVAKPLLASRSCKGISSSVHIQIFVDLVIAVLCILFACM